MEIESAGLKFEVVEEVELDRDENVGEGGRLSAARVEIGVAGKGKSSSRVSKVS